jgi:hypothetical protein
VNAAQDGDTEEMTRDSLAEILLNEPVKRKRGSAAPPLRESKKGK